MNDFLQAALSFLSISDHPVCVAVSERLSAVDFSTYPDRSATQHSKPLACRHLIEAFSSSNAIELTKHLAAISDHLIWWEAPRGKISSLMDDNHAVVEIVGPDADFVSDKLRFGVFLLAPNTSYPLHSHSAEEIYVPISGSGQWRLRDSSYEPRQLGSVIHIRPWVPHAIRSSKEPLLLLWAWLGNIDFDAYQIEPNAFDEDGEPFDHFRVGP